MHNTYFDAVYDGCHVLFLVYLSCEMGDNRGIWNSNSLVDVVTSALFYLVYYKTRTSGRAVGPGRWGGGYIP